MCLAEAFRGACPLVNHSHRAPQGLGIESTFLKEHLWVPGVRTFISLQGRMPKANAGNKDNVQAGGILFTETGTVVHSICTCMVFMTQKMGWERDNPNELIFSNKQIFWFTKNTTKLFSNFFRFLHLIFNLKTTYMQPTCVSSQAGQWVPCGVLFKSESERGHWIREFTAVRSDGCALQPSLSAAGYAKPLLHSRTRRWAKTSAPIGLPFES